MKSRIYGCGPRAAGELAIELARRVDPLPVLEQLPKVQLMPTLTVPEVDAVLRSQAARRQGEPGLFNARGKFHG